MIICLMSICQASQNWMNVRRQINGVNMFNQGLRWDRINHPTKRKQQSQIDYAHMLPLGVYNDNLGKIVCLDIKFFALLADLKTKQAEIVNKESAMLVNSNDDEEIKALKNQIEGLSETIERLTSEILSTGLTLLSQHKAVGSVKDSNYWKFYYEQEEPMSRYIDNYYSLVKLDYIERAEIELLNKLISWVKSRFDRATISAKEHQIAKRYLEEIDAFIEVKYNAFRNTEQEMQE